MTTYGQNPEFPIGPPSLSGTTYTVDWLTQQPSRITNVIANIALQRFFIDRIFSPAGDITGGAVIYDVATANDLYATRDVERVEPGRSFPIVTFDRGAPLTAQVEKFGARFYVTDEARRRNQTGVVNRDIQKLANTIIRKVQQRAIAELAAAVTTYSRTAVGTRWDTAAATTAANKVLTVGPLADLAMIQQLNATQELGYSYDGAIMHPTDYFNLRLAAGGEQGSAEALLRDSGITNLWVTNRKAAKSVYWFSAGQAGDLGYELPLYTRTWRDEDREQDWYQSGVLPIMYVTDPYAILETTGHAP